jgi:hypothetical protein
MEVHKSQFKEECTMSVNAVNNVTGDAYAAYSTTAAATAKETETAASAKTTSEGTTQAEQGVVYEKSEESSSSKATYSINKMSASDREALVKQLQADQESRKQSLIDLVQNMISKQATSFASASDDDSIWKFLAGGDFTVDAATKAQAQADIAEDGYWGVTQTSQRLFDFASALAGDDVDKMKEMQEAMEKGFKQATKSWGSDLPQISQDTLAAANQLFEDYYKSKESTDTE